MSDCIAIKRLNDQLQAGGDPNRFVPDEIPQWLTREGKEEWLMWCIVHLTDGREKIARKLLYESWTEDVRRERSAGMSVPASGADR